MRAADSDRQFVAEQLQQALNQGRLTLTEYDERLQQAYAARTYGELDGLLGDLPTVAPAAKSQVANAAPGSLAEPGQIVGSGSGSGRRGAPGWLLAGWGGWLSTSLTCTVIWLLTNPTGFPWPLWVAGPLGAVLLGRTIMAYASGDPHSYGQGYRDRQQRRNQERWERRHQRWERNR